MEADPKYHGRFDKLEVGEAPAVRAYSQTRSGADDHPQAAAQSRYLEGWLLILAKCAVSIG
jgi:hypothetical protein